MLIALALQLCCWQQLCLNSTGQPALATRSQTAQMIINLLMPQPFGLAMTQHTGKPGVSLKAALQVLGFTELFTRHMQPLHCPTSPTVH